jgi:peroxiredoxin
MYHSIFSSQEEGYETIACISVNDPYVMQAWGEMVDPEHRVSDLKYNYSRIFGSMEFII